MSLETYEGAIMYTGRNWRQKWSRTKWLIQEGRAYPQSRQHFWCSVRGNVDDLRGQPSVPIKINGNGRLEINGFEASKYET